VGLSGGLDSTVLLHALAQLPDARARGLRALHVDHGIQAASAQWAQSCTAFAQRLGLDCTIVRAERVESAGRGVEDAARAARQRAFADALADGELLALAHHADDQAETVLLKLLRGAGPEGLGGMRALRAFAAGWLWRPLLDLTRAQLRAHAEAHALDWIEDPSNADTRLRRNFLRGEILPRLRERWPQAQAAIAHSARWAGAAAQFIADEARAALARLRGADAATLDWRGWLALPDALRDPVLREWLRALELDAPEHLHVAELERQLRGDADRLPCVRWQGTEVRRYRKLLYATRVLPPVPPAWQHEWDGTRLALPSGGTLAFERIGDAGTHALAPRLTIAYRRGGERIRPDGSAHTRELRLLLQEAGVPPWIRPRLPLLYRGGELVAVADLFLSAAGRELCERHGARIAWNPAG
jgi:tRNA(Ile)-lysidine synthase